MTARPCRICALSKKDEIGSSTPRKHSREYPRARFQARRHCFPDFFPNRVWAAHGLGSWKIFREWLDRGVLAGAAIFVQILWILVGASVAGAVAVHSLGCSRRLRAVYCRRIFLP